MAQMKSGCSNIMGNNKWLHEFVPSPMIDLIFETSAFLFYLSASYGSYDTSSEWEPRESYRKIYDQSASAANSVDRSTEYGYKYVTTPQQHQDYYNR